MVQGHTVRGSNGASQSKLVGLYPTLRDRIAGKMLHDGFNRYNLAVGEAMVSGYAAYGLSHRQYRTAVKNLEKWGFATFKTTNKGTIATLTSSSVFDISGKPNDKQPDRPQTNKGQAGDKRATTNEEREEGKERKNEIRSTENRSPRSCEHAPKKNGMVTLEIVDKSPPYNETKRLEDWCLQLLGKDEMAKYGSRWRKRIENNPERMEAVLGETKSALNEGRIKTTTAQYAEDYLARLEGKKPL